MSCCLWGSMPGPATYLCRGQRIVSASVFKWGPASSWQFVRLWFCTLRFSLSGNLLVFVSILLPGIDHTLTVAFFGLWLSISSRVLISIVPQFFSFLWDFGFVWLVNLWEECWLLFNKVSSFPLYYIFSWSLYSLTQRLISDIVSCQAFAAAEDWLLICSSLPFVKREEWGVLFNYFLICMFCKLSSPAGKAGLWHMLCIVWFFLLVIHFFGVTLVGQSWLPFVQSFVGSLFSEFGQHSSVRPFVHWKLLSLCVLLCYLCVHRDNVQTHWGEFKFRWGFLTYQLCNKSWALDQITVSVLWAHAVHFITSSLRWSWWHWWGQSCWLGEDCGHWHWQCLTCLILSCTQCSLTGLTALYTM